jgi:transglutaminase-like putative cysteine protease
MIAAALLAAALLEAAAPEPPPVFFGEIPVEMRAARAWRDGSGLRLLVEHPAISRGPALELVRRKPGHAVDAEHTRLDPIVYAIAREPPTAAERRPSFVIDFDEPAVRALAREARAALGPRPSLAGLAGFVRRSLRQNMSRGFDIASTVAVRREGDCTEHAVLLAALARAFRVPARVVLGVALIGGDRVAAFGHAWVEYFSDGRWQPADAALVGLGRPVVYLPVTLLLDEGPGFVGAAAAAAALMIRKVVIEERARD